MAGLPNLLSWTSFLPLGVGVALIAANGALRSLGADGLPERVWKAVGLAATLATFGLSLLAWRAFDPTQSGYQFVEWAPWLPEWGIHWFVGIDGVHANGTHVGPPSLGRPTTLPHYVRFWPHSASQSTGRIRPKAVVQKTG